MAMASVAMADDTGGGAGTNGVPPPNGVSSPNGVHRVLQPLTNGVHRALQPLTNGVHKVQDALDDAAAAVMRVVDTNRLELWHDVLSSRLVARVERFDNFFGDARLEDDNRETRVKVGVGATASAEDGLSLETRVQTRLALPGVKERLHLVFDDLVERDGEDDAGVSAVARDSRPDTALRWIVQQTRRMRVSADAGLRVGQPTQVLGRLRWRWIVPYEQWELRLSDVVDWYSGEGFGQTSEMRWSRPFVRGWLFQSVSSLRWEEQADGVRPSQSLSFSRVSSPVLAQRLAVDGVWPGAPDCEDARYRGYYSCRKRIYSDWLFAEVRPGVSFAQEHEYRADPFLTVLFELVFGDAPDA
jgi:hypothetical protein